MIVGQHFSLQAIEPNINIQIVSHILVKISKYKQYYAKSYFWLNLLQEAVWY